MKIYLDANIIYGFFKNIINEERKGKKFTDPSILKFLKESKLELYTSVLVKAEIARRLRTEWGCSAEEVIELWNSFEDYLNSKMIETAIIDSQIVDIATKIPMKKRISNMMHLLIAKQYDLWFLTGDKEIIEKCKPAFDKIISYIELRRKIHVS